MNPPTLPPPIRTAHETRGGGEAVCGGSQRQTRTVLAIDPGPTHSAYCFLDGEVVTTEHVDNETLLICVGSNDWFADLMALEWVECFGKPVGAETFETVYWIGRFYEAWSREGNGTIVRIPRPKIKHHLCNDRGAKDPNVRRVLMDRFGGDGSIKKGKSCPKCRNNLGAMYEQCSKCGGTGMLVEDAPLARVSGHGWAALAVAVTASDLDAAAIEAAPKGRTR